MIPKLPNSTFPHQILSPSRGHPKELRLSTAAKMPRSVQRLQLNLDLEPRRRWEEFLGQVSRAVFLSGKI